jgi:hypothetical protein
LAASVDEPSANRDLTHELCRFQPEHQSTALAIALVLLVHLNGDAGAAEHFCSSIAKQVSRGGDLNVLRPFLTGSASRTWRASAMSGRSGTLPPARRRLVLVRSESQLDTRRDYCFSRWC